MSQHTNELADAVAAFDTTEANLQKLEQVCAKLEAATPQGTIFGSDQEYEKWRFHYRRMGSQLPAIDGFKIDPIVPDYNEVAQWRLDALEVGEFSAQIAVEEDISAPSRQLREYRLLLETKRRELLLHHKENLCVRVDALLDKLTRAWGTQASSDTIVDSDFEALEQTITELEVILGVKDVPPRWKTLKRHLGFRQVQDLNDIKNVDWPSISRSLNSLIFGDTDSIPVGVEDLGELVRAKPTGPIPTRLDWSVLTDESFERLIFSLLASSPGYENPQWLSKTRSPDAGRDLSVLRVNEDLSGTQRLRVIIQCRHWQSRSVNLEDVTVLERQMRLWQPPVVDSLIIATTGWFTRDAIAYIESLDSSDDRLRIYMWPQSHLERLLALRPDLVAEFGLPRIAP